MLNTVIFDMDGLLVDSEPLWRDAMAAVFAKLDTYLEKEDYIKTMGIRTSEVVKYWHARFQWKGKSAEEVEQEIYEEIVHLIKTEGKKMEGVDELLDFFKKRDFKIGLASSSPMLVIESVLSHFQLKDYFEEYHSAEFEPFGKPHPAVYLSCAKELNAVPRECLVFEDSINGLIAAKAAQMKAVAVPAAEDFEKPQFSIADLKIASLKEFGEKELASLSREE